jgi:probable F420-dependent oxidoreductase
VKLGIITPVLTLTPGGHARWERDGTIEDVRRIAQAADELGYDHLTCSEHVAVPLDAVPTRGGRYWDPLATFGYLAAHTSHVRFMTNVLVLGYHHPLAIAKRYGTLDRLSGGRLVLGVGVGSLREEFELLSAPFEDRGARGDDSLRALRAALSDSTPTYKGEYFQFADMVVDPCAVQDRVPLWIGGRTARSLRRAVELADGWCPFAVSPEQATTWLAKAAATDAWAARDDPLEVVLQTQRPLDPAAAREQAADAARQLQEAGATTLSLRLVHHSVEHYVEQLEAMASVVAALD